jgi:hypothetical protein
MCDYDQEDIVNHSQCLPSFLIINESILNAQRKGIVENQRRSFEADLVFCEVGAVLFVIPLEASHLWVDNNIVHTE